MSRTQRVLAYDALRVFAIVTVVAIHTLMPYRELLPPTAPVRVFDDLLHYAVPLFVFISGVFVWGRTLPAEKASADKIDWGPLLSRRISIVLVPYLAWSALYMTLLARQEPGSLSPLRVLGLLLTGHTWYHLYFVPMLLTFYLLTPLAVPILRRSPELLLVGCYLLRILAGPEIAAAFRVLFGDLGWSYAVHIVTHLPHMALGAWFAVRHDRLPKQGWFAALLLAFGTTVLLAASLGATEALQGPLSRLIYPVGMAATVLGMALGALSAERFLEPYGRSIVVASALAFGVYLIHPLFLLGIDALLSAQNGEMLWMQAWFPATVFISVTAASFSASAVLARLPAVCRLVGVATPLRLSGSERDSG